MGGGGGKTSGVTCTPLVGVGVVGMMVGGSTSVMGWHVTGGEMCGGHMSGIVGNLVKGIPEGGGGCPCLVNVQRGWHF